MEKTTRRGLLALGLVAAGGFVSVRDWTPTRERVYNVTRPPNSDPRTDRIVAGEPDLESGEGRRSLLILTDERDAEEGVNWDALAPEERTKPYREVGHRREVTTVVSVVLPRTARLNDRGSQYIRNGRVHHEVGVLRDEGGNVNVETGLTHHYMFSKWDLNGHGVPETGTVELREDS